MFSSLRFRLWLTYALLVALVIGIVTLALLVYLVRNPADTRQELQRISLVSALILQRGEAPLSFAPTPLPTGLTASLDRADQAFGVRLLVFSPQGELLYDSRGKLNPQLPALRVFIERQKLRQPSLRDQKNRLWLFDLRQADGGKYLVVLSPRPRLNAAAVLRDEFLAPMLRSAVLALLLALLLALAIARWIAAPLQRMGQAARAVSAGEFHPIPVEGPGEVQELAKAFNEMTARVQASQQSQRDFVANVSHELKTPLTSIQGFAQAILDGAAATPEALHQAAGVIYDESARMHRLVLDLLDLARMDAGTVRFEHGPVNLAALLRAVTEKLTPLAARAQVSLQLENGALPEVTGDTDRLAQVFTNLVDNAIKYTPAGGQVRVSAQPVEAGVEVEVVDSGPGIPPSELERIFERFYQTDKSRRGGDRRGVGLGLPIAREIVLAHGGSLAARNNPGQGSTFVVKLPLTRPTETLLTKGKGKREA